MLPREFIRNRIRSDAFLNRFLEGSGALEALLEEQELAPGASFLHDCDSSVEPYLVSAREGRFLTGGGGVPPPRRAAWGGEWDGGLRWRPELSLGGAKARLRVPFDIPRELHVVEWGRAGDVGTTSRGAAVCVAGDYLYVIGGVDVNGRATAANYRAALDPRLVQLARKDFKQIAYMHTARAWCSCAVFTSQLPPKTPKSPKAKSPMASPRTAASPRHITFADSAASVGVILPYAAGGTPSKGLIVPSPAGEVPSRLAATEPAGRLVAFPSPGGTVKVSVTQKIIVGTGEVVSLPTKTTERGNLEKVSPLWMGTVHPQTTDIEVWRTVGEFSTTPEAEGQPRECLYVFGGYDEHG